MPVNLTKAEIGPRLDNFKAQMLALIPEDAVITEVGGEVGENASPGLRYVNGSFFLAYVKEEPTP